MLDSARRPTAAPDGSRGRGRARRWHVLFGLLAASALLGCFTVRAQRTYEGPERPLEEVAVLWSIGTDVQSIDGGRAQSFGNALAQGALQQGVEFHLLPGRHSITASYSDGYFRGAPITRTAQFEKGVVYTLRNNVGVVRWTFHIVALGPIGDVACNRNLPEWQFREMPAHWQRYDRAWCARHHGHPVGAMTARHARPRPDPERDSSGNGPMSNGSAPAVAPEPSGPESELASAQAEPVSVAIWYRPSSEKSPPLSISIDGGEAFVLESGTEVIEKLSRARHEIRIARTDGTVSETSGAVGRELSIDFEELAEPSIIIDGSAGSNGVTLGVGLWDRGMELAEDESVLHEVLPPRPRLSRLERVPGGSETETHATRPSHPVPTTIEYDGDLGVAFKMGVSIDGGEIYVLEPGTRLEMDIAAGNHTLTLVDPETGIFHAPQWEDHDFTLELGPVEDAVVRVELRSRFINWALTVSVLADGEETARYETNLVQ